MNQTLFRHPKPNPEDVAQTHEVRRIEVAHDPALSFGVPVPVSMATALPGAYEPRGHEKPEPLALFGEPAGRNVSVNSPKLLVSAHTLHWEVDPLEWLRWLWAKEGWRIAHAQTHPGPAGPRYELAALKEVEGEAIVRRCMATRSGARLVRCDATAALSAWAQWHDALWWALDGFHLGTVSAGTIEAMVAYEGPFFGFAVPGSWEARGQSMPMRTGKDVRGMAWALQPFRHVQRGAAMKIHAQRLEDAPSAEQRRASLWRDFRASGARMGGVLEAKRVEFAELVPGWVGQWQAAMQMSRGDGVIVVVQREDAGVALDYVLASPAAGTEHVDWMRATRALDVAIATSDIRGADVEAA